MSNVNEEKFEATKENEAMNPEETMETVPEKKAKKKLISIEMDPKVKKVLTGVGIVLGIGTVVTGTVVITRKVDAKHFGKIIDGMKETIKELRNVNIPVEQATELITDNTEEIVETATNVFDNI